MEKRKLYPHKFMGKECIVVGKKKIEFLKLLIKSFPKFLTVEEIEESIKTTRGTVRSCYIFWKMLGIDIERKEETLLIEDSNGNTITRKFVKYRLKVGEEKWRKEMWL